MKIFLADGRLGNQIFQYLFLKTLQQEREKLLVSGLDDLLNVFEIKDKTLLHIPKRNKWIRRIIYKGIKPMFLNPLASAKIINSLEIIREKVLEKYSREIPEYEFREGMLKKITYVKLGFFQSEKFFDKNLTKNLKIKQKWLIQARNFLAPVEENYKVFVHIRRGDYKNFKIYGKTTLLPMEYFHNRIKWFLENRRNVSFVFLSDEPKFIEQEFAYLENKLISENSYETDFAIMTLCNGAVLSPSSFGWWGSYLMKERDVVFAPKYCLGFASGIEYQKFSLASFMKDVEISKL